MTPTALVLENPWKPCDLRGVYPQPVSPALFRRIGGAIGTMLPAHSRVVVAGDFRLSTPQLKKALTEGLMQTGARVLDAGQCPTPVAYFTAKETGVGAVLIVTASHNPPAHNGLKLMLGAEPTTPEQFAEVRSIAESGAFRTGAGSVELIDPSPAYVQAMMQRWTHLRRAQRTRVVLDPGNGAWSELAPAIFAQFGFESDCISCFADGRFPDRSPDCARASNLARLSEAVRRLPGAIGVAWDGDGDRVAFVDEDGRYVTPDEIAMLFTRAALANTSLGANRKIVVDLKCSEAVPREVLQQGGVPLHERTGHAFMRRRMVAEDALLGLDACGHYFFRELNGSDDGLFAAIYLLDLVRKSGVSLRELRCSLPRIFATPEIRIPLSAVPYVKACDALACAFPGTGLTQIDGLRFAMSDGVVLLRESGTEPVLSLRIEGFSADAHARILAQCLQSLPEAARLLEPNTRNMYTA